MADLFSLFGLLRKQKLDFFTTKTASRGDPNDMTLLALFLLLFYVLKYKASQGPCINGTLRDL